MKATLSYYCSVRKWPLDLPESLSWDVCYKIGMPFPNGWLVGYENFPFVITENQSQIPPWESLVKVKNKLKKHECLRHSCFLNLFFLSLVTLRQEFDSDFLWSLMGNFHTPLVIRWGILHSYILKETEPEPWTPGNTHHYLWANPHQAVYP